PEQGRGLGTDPPVHRRAAGHGARPPKFRIAVGARWGRVCQCDGGKCEDAPTPESPACLEDIPCIECKAAPGAVENCRRCNGDGYEKLTRCPYDEVPR